ncbi:FAD-binding oxidoreductase [Amycolatopsis oliviviridis]|uniref:Oxidoreductase n=1 Tax=Amycolatopsis oliviviridis TaxID=1471590 RepID=A0ABQ3L9B0_9PSEU|nr:FAD-binding oxidoreductase [Amycolatopsis oliviviridis]GHH05341.1 oxidoreductase [Amycolatopsis oliviviridis]
MEPTSGRTPSQFSFQAGQKPASRLVDRLRDILESPVIGPGDPGYDRARASFNTLTDHRPQAVVRAESADDVARAVGLAREIQIPIAVQTTGHGMGTSAPDSALLIELRHLDDVEVDPDGRTARVGGGATWDQVVAATAPWQLAPPIGSTGDVGVAGYVTGGGVSFLGRQYGYAADNVREIELITPDGCRRRLTAHDEPELFWAVRGGKSNFGVVTSLVIDLMPVSEVYAGVLTFGADSVERAFHGFLAWTRTVTDATTSVAVFRRLPRANEPSMAPHDRCELVINVVHVGSASSGRRELAGLRELCPDDDTVTAHPVARINALIPGPTQPGTFVSASGLLSGIDTARADRVLRAVGPEVKLSPGLIEVRHLGGRFSKAPETPNAIAHRDAAFALYVTNPAISVVHAAALASEHRALLATLGPGLTGGRIPTFLGTSDVAPDAVASAYATADWARLRELKRRWDPDNLFRVNHNIR